MKGRTMKKIFRCICVLVLSCITYLCFLGQVKAQGYSEVIVEGGYKFLLYYNHAIQSHVVDGNDIYIQQAYNENEFDEFEDYKTGGMENLILISRCQYSAEYDAYKPVDHMVLRDVGHGQTLQVYRYNGKKYLMISCGGKESSRKFLWWSTQIGRVEYKPGAFLDNSEIKRLTYLNYSNKKTKRFGTTMRVDATLTPDKKMLVIWKMNEKGQSEYVGYKMSAVNKELDKAKNNTVNIKENKKLKKAAVFSTKAHKLSVRSFQGFAVSNRTKGKYFIYISSGNERLSKERGISIYKYEVKGSKIKYSKRIRLSAKDVWSSFPPDTEEENDADVTASSKNGAEAGVEDGGYEDDDYDDEGYYTEDEDDEVLVEIEDIKIVGSELHFVLRNTGDADQQLICTISQNEF